MDECTGLENQRAARHRGFESHPLRHSKIELSGMPEHIRSDHGSWFTAEAVRLWLNLLKIKPLYIEPGSPWENGYIESFHDTFSDELLDRKVPEWSIGRPIEADRLNRFRAREQI